MPWTGSEETQPKIADTTLLEFSEDKHTQIRCFTCQLESKIHLISFFSHLINHKLISLTQDKWKVLESLNGSYSL